MALCSMTGFGAAEVQADGWLVRVECRSVNHRSLEARAQTSQACRWAEAVALEKLKGRVHRGRVDLRIEATRPTEATRSAGAVAGVDVGRFVALSGELTRLAGELGLQTPLSVMDVASFSRAFGRSEEQSIAPGAPFVGEAIDAALEAFVASRVREGEGIARDLGRHLDTIGTHHGAIRDRVPLEMEEMRRRLGDRIAEALARLGAEGLDEGRMAQEVAFLADRSDISEEIQRAGSHLERLVELVGQGSSDGVTGKTMDFYLQELMREANTMGSKSASARLTGHVIAIKAAIEKLREQCANVE